MYLRALCLAFAASLSTVALAQPGAAQTRADPRLLRTQVILDRLGFSPGVIDGQQGFTFKLAVSGFQRANRLPATGSVDPKTAAALARFAAVPTVVTIKLTQADMAGPYVGRLPPGEDQQAKLPALGYASLMEMLGERYHTTPATLIALNSPTTKLFAGAAIRVPNVLTAGRAYPGTLPAAYRQALAGLNVDSNQPQAVRVVVDKSDRSLSAYDARGRLIAQFPVTTGSRHDPLPIGRWKIQGASYNPEYHFNPKLFWDARKGQKQATLPPGPNGPVGIVWLDLNRPHYGIHGTPEPRNIGHTESHGCVRLTNWDAGRLSLMVKPGTPAVFKP